MVGVVDGTKAWVKDAVIVPGPWVLTVEFKFVGTAIRIPEVALHVLNVQLFEPDASIEKTASAGSHEIPVGVVVPQLVGLANMTMEYSCWYAVVL